MHPLRPRPPPPTDFFSSSNLSPQDAFLLALHTQIADLQDELRLYRGQPFAASRYYYATFQVPLSIPEWNHWAAPELLVGRDTGVLDAPEESNSMRVSVYILLPYPTHLLPSASHACRTIRPLDSFEFYQGIRQWLPGENDAWAWCRSLPGDIYDPEYQATLRARWTEANLVEWVSMKDETV